MSALIALSVNSVRSGGLPLIGDWSPEARLAQPTGGSMLITLAEAKEAFLAGQAVFVDARSKDTFEMGHIKSARSLPFEDFDASLQEALTGVSKDTLIVSYCDGEQCDLSKDVADMLKDKGYSNVKVLVNGWTVWSQAGLPTE
jgi:rhodanese-related sulfurtransferase